jgi:hypothetical protein
VGNLTGDTHPMHLVMHQVVGRVPFDVEAYTGPPEPCGDRRLCDSRRRIPVAAPRR